MAAVEQYSKIKIKRSTTAGELPTMGVTNDHTDGTWSSTDIYVGEYFYNVIDNRLWIGGVTEPIELILGQLFELTYAEAELQKTIVGSPSGDGLIIGALYKITDRGDAGLILQAIDFDKFSFYCDELIASPVGQQAAIYDFDNDLLSYPSDLVNITELGDLTGVRETSPTSTFDVKAVLGVDIFGFYRNGGEALLIGRGDASYRLDFYGSTGIEHTMRSGKFGFGVANNTPNAIVEIASTTSGLVIPRMTATQGSAVTGINGMMIYVTSTNGTFTSVGFWGYENGAWVKL